MEGIRVKHVGSIPKDGGGIEIIEDDDDGYDTYDYTNVPEITKLNMVKEIHVLPERQKKQNIFCLIYCCLLELNRKRRLLDTVVIMMQQFYFLKRNFILMN